MARFLFTAGAYLTLAPVLLVLAGAARKVWCNWQRVARLQLEGAAILAVAVLSRFLLAGYIASVDQARGTSLAYWYDRGENGFLAVGLILFFLGFFLERRPRPGLEPWPPRLTQAARLWLCAWLCLAVYVVWRGNTWDGAPWSPLHVCVALGFLYFSGAYCYLAFARPGETRSAEGDLVGIEE